MHKRVYDNHRRQLELLAAHPEVLGIENVIATMIEPTFFDNNKNIISQPDILFLDRNMTWYLVEYKQNKNNKSQKKAERQLYQSVKWCSKRGIIPKTIVANGETYEKLQQYLDNKNSEKHRSEVRDQYPSFGR